MSDLISRQAAIEVLTEIREMINAVLDSLTLDYNTIRNQEQRQGQINEDIEMIKDLPSIDAVPVVRCRDCIHRPTGTGANHDLEFPDYVCPCQCDVYHYSWMPKDDWFCRDGERKKE